jgi:hypothetical protein
MLSDVLEIYADVGDAVFSASRIPPPYKPRITGYLQHKYLTRVKKDQDGRNWYRVSDRVVRIYHAAGVLQDPEVISDLQDGNLSLRALSEITGLSNTALKNRLNTDMDIPAQ